MAFWFNTFLIWKGNFERRIIKLINSNVENVCVFHRKCHQRLPVFNYDYNVGIFCDVMELNLVSSLFFRIENVDIAIIAEKNKPIYEHFFLNKCFFDEHEHTNRQYAKKYRMHVMGFLLILSNSEISPGDDR